MKMNPKHKSKLQLGFEKQRLRQDAKPEYVKITIQPIILSWNSKHSEYRPLKRKFWNNKWNGMNLKNLCNSFTQVQPGWLYSKKRINKDGKYVLSFHGEQILRKKKLKKMIKDDKR